VATGGGTPAVRIATSTGDGVGSFLGVAGSGIWLFGAGLNGAAIGSPPNPHLRTAGAAKTASMVEVADRLVYHLRNGGTCYVAPNDAALSSYATCSIKPGTVPRLQLSDRRTMEFTLSLQLINTAVSPTRMLAHFGEQ